MRPCLICALVLGACGTRESAERDAEVPDASPPDGGTPTGPLPDCRPRPTDCNDVGDARPGRLSEHVGVYDQTRLELIVFGGTATVSEACSFGGPVEFNADTWIYDDRCNAWTHFEGDAPSASGRHMAAWGNGNVWVFGGRYRSPTATSGSYTLYDDLFRFDVAKRSWHGVDTTGEVPEARVNGGLAWDDHRQLLWLFGGSTSEDGAVYAPDNDLWSFDPDEGQWTRRNSLGAPAARLFHAMLYDAERDRLVVFGGADAGAFDPSAGYFNDLWALDIEQLQWEALDPGGAGGPEGRFWASLVYDRDADEYVLFGGHDDRMLGNRNDTWRFDPDDLMWTRIAEGDTFNNPSTGLCEFPPDFTDVALDVPERRNAHSMVWSDACDHGLVFGGKTDCGATDDVWFLDDDGWHERLKATEGEVCLRWRDDPETCADMCF